VTPTTSLPELAAIGVERLRGVGTKAADSLAQVGITTVADLLTYYPRRYIDRSRQLEIADLNEGDEAMVLAKVRRVSTRRPRRQRPVVEVDLFDGTSYLRATFFNQPWRARQLAEGTEAVIFGRVERYRGRLQMTNPLVDLVGDRTGRIVAIYPQSEKAGINSWELAGWIKEALRRSRTFVDPLPEPLRSRLELPSRDWAMRQIHMPESAEAHEAARRRLAFDELLRLQALLVVRKRAIETRSAGIRHRSEGTLVSRFLEGLPYRLTVAQQRALDEIVADMQGAHPMHRLLQGDVGSGKTVVAVAALLLAVQGGHQGALMAPTEVLAEQHHSALGELLGDLRVQSEANLLGERPLQVGLLTSRTSGRERGRLLEALKQGELDIVIGTHALLTEGVAFHSLGLVVIDEQHRFGVEQRAALRDKGPGVVVPDVLVMTATPIPRTAAMTVYGDLDTTILDEMPPGRTPVVTRWAPGELEQAQCWDHLRAEVSSGRQAYVVCPLVEESDKIEARAAAAERDRLAEGVLAGLRIGLLHGQMPAREREEVMGQFRRGGLDVLVTTTVIEVGVDVPNATVMVVQDAGRFGLAQLHQLRGRVGRGLAQSWCWLLGNAGGVDAEERLRAMESTNDGFELAEVDLDLRGEGTILGVRQKGASDLKLASLRRDRALVALAREVAFELVDGHPGLEGLDELAAEIRLLLDPAEREYLFKS
jgi:ATP-dependent DNA helicase RecG